MNKQINEIYELSKGTEPIIFKIKALMPEAVLERRRECLAKLAGRPVILIDGCMDFVEDLGESLKTKLYKTALDIACENSGCRPYPDKQCATDSDCSADLCCECIKSWALKEAAKRIKNCPMCGRKLEEVKE